MQISQSFRDKLIILCFLGHNVRTTVARKSSKGSTDLDFSLAYFTRKKGTIPCSLVSSRMMSSENHVNCPLFSLKNPPPARTVMTHFGCNFSLVGSPGVVQANPFWKGSQGSSKETFWLFGELPKNHFRKFKNLYFSQKYQTKGTFLQKHRTNCRLPNLSKFLLTLQRNPVPRYCRS